MPFCECWFILSSWCTCAVSHACHQYLCHSNIMYPILSSGLNSPMMLYFTIKVHKSLLFLRSYKVHLAWTLQLALGLHIILVFLNLFISHWEILIKQLSCFWYQVQCCWVPNWKYQQSLWAAYNIVQDTSGTEIIANKSSKIRHVNLTSWHSNCTRNKGTTWIDSSVPLGAGNVDWDALQMYSPSQTNQHGHTSSTDGLNASQLPMLIHILCSPHR